MPGSWGVGSPGPPHCWHPDPQDSVCSSHTAPAQPLSPGLAQGVHPEQDTPPPLQSQTLPDLCGQSGTAVPQLSVPELRALGLGPPPISSTRRVWRMAKEELPFLKQTSSVGGAGTVTPAGALCGGSYVTPLPKPVALPGTSSTLAHLAGAHPVAQAFPSIALTHLFSTTPLRPFLSRHGFGPTPDMVTEGHHSLSALSLPVG